MHEWRGTDKGGGGNSEKEKKIEKRQTWLHFCNKVIFYDELLTLRQSEQGFTTSMGSFGPR